MRKVRFLAPTLLLGALLLGACSDNKDEKEAGSSVSEVVQVDEGSKAVEGFYGYVVLASNDSEGVDVEALTHAQTATEMLNKYYNALATNDTDTAKDFLKEVINPSIIDSELVKYKLNDVAIEIENETQFEGLDEDSNFTLRVEGVITLTPNDKLIIDYIEFLKADGEQDELSEVQEISIGELTKGENKHFSTDFNFSVIKGVVRLVGIVTAEEDVPTKTGEVNSTGTSITTDGTTGSATTTIIYDASETNVKGEEDSSK